MTEKDRSVEYDNYEVDGKTYHDKLEINSYTYSSPSWDGEGWYRVEGEAGTRLAEKDQYPGYYHCGSYAPGYMNAKHSDIGKYQTEQVVFCFDSTCAFEKREGRITNCNSYFVYYLPETAAYRRYCSVP